MATKKPKPKQKKKKKQRKIQKILKNEEALLLSGGRRIQWSPSRTAGGATRGKGTAVSRKRKEPEGASDRENAKKQRARKKKKKSTAVTLSSARGRYTFFSARLSRSRSGTPPAELLSSSSELGRRGVPRYPLALGPPPRGPYTLKRSRTTETENQSVARAAALSPSYAYGARIRRRSSPSLGRYPLSLARRFILPFALHCDDRGREGTGERLGCRRGGGQRRGRGQGGSKRRGGGRESA